MASRRTTKEGLHPPSRQRSPSPDNPQYHYDSLNAALSHQPVPPRTRRRSSRTGSNGKTSPPSALPSCVDGDWEGGNRTNPARNTLKKNPPRRDSAYSDISVHSHDTQGEEGEGSAYRPRLGKIHEGKVSRASSSQTSSGTSSISEPRTRRRQTFEDQAVDRTRAHRRRRSSQRHSESPARSSHSSLASASSQATTRHSTSTGSGPTATQRSYEGGSAAGEQAFQPPHIRRSRKAPKTPMATTEEYGETDVFQFMSESSGPQDFTFTVEEAHDTPPSTTAPSSSSSSDAEDEDEDEADHASDSASSHPGDTPTTSPPSLRRSHSDTSQKPHVGYRARKKPLYASSFVHGPEEDEEHEEHEEHEEEEEEHEEDEEESGQSGEEHSDEQSDEEEDDDGHSDIVHDNSKCHQAPKRPSPRTAPSATAPRYDTHAERLKQRERDLANHVLQSPQPHKGFQFAGGPSPNPVPPMPLYSPRAYSAATATTYEATAPYHPEWPSFPAPLPISYPSQAGLESPHAAHALPLTVQPPVQQPVSSPQQDPGQPPPHYQAHVPTTEVARTTVVGYELLASKLSEPLKGSKAVRKAGNIVPMYRKFEYLNHRVLLHLQDEICELEEELRAIDECIVQMSPKDETGQTYPASRRGDAEYGNDMHFKRTELLGRIFQKLGQYNQAFTSFNNLVKDVEPASPTDIQSYRAWIDKRAPIDQVESRFLERRHDLVAVPRKRSISPGRGEQAQSAAVWLPLVLVLPLLAFAIVPSLLGRLVVIVLIGAGKLRLVTTTPEIKRLMSVQEWTLAAAFYFGVMALLAGLVG